MVKSNDLGNDYNIGYSFKPQYVWTVSMYGNIEHICSSEDKAIALQKALFDAEFEGIFTDGDIDAIMNDEIAIEQVELE